MGFTRRVSVLQSVFPTFAKYGIILAEENLLVQPGTRNSDEKPLTQS